MHELVADAVTAGSDVHRAAPELEERAIAGPEAELQFCAAAFDAEEHD